MKNKLRRARALSAGDWRILSQAWGLLLAVDVGLRTVGFQRVERRLRAAASRRAAARSRAEEAAVIRRVTEIVDTAAKWHLYPMTCLRRALALQWLLRRRGIEVELRFGVRRVDGGLAAHAWLERDGQPVSEPQALEGKFARLGEMTADRRG